MRSLPVVDNWGLALAFAVGAILVGVLCGAIESLTKLEARRRAVYGQRRV